jgi:hypothetical protein
LERPPRHPEGTEKGDLAREHDDITTKMASVQLSMGGTIKWYVENPEAYLQYRPQMAQLGEPRTVHYCAYWSRAEALEWRPIRKPTHIWTNAATWRPKGSTGTGLCEHRCQYRDKEGKHRKMEGKGEAWQKARMPAALVREWALSWMPWRNVRLQV